MALEVRASLPYMAEIIDRREMVRDLCIAADPTYSRNRKWHRLVQSCEDAECILLVSQNGADARDISEDYFQWSVDFNIWSVVCRRPVNQFPFPRPARMFDPPFTNTSVAVHLRIRQEERDMRAAGDHNMVAIVQRVQNYAAQVEQERTREVLQWYVNQARQITNEMQTHQNANANQDYQVSSPDNHENANGNQANHNANGNANGKANGRANGDTNGNSNGNANGKANGNANGNSNGNANGKANGKANGDANGNANGNVDPAT